MATEEVDLEFNDEGLQRIAEVAYEVNEKQENIGARRLYTVMERLLEQISFEASDMRGQHILIDAEYVNQHLADLSADEDLSQYIL
jgi:ATP-dependent HslUV protease ATP-binding subunit HslU